MIPETVITKRYLEGQILPVQNEISSLRLGMKEQKFEIINAVRVMIFEAMETVRVYYQDQENRRMGALKEGFRDDLRFYGDQMRTLNEKVDTFTNQNNLKQK